MTLAGDFWSADDAVLLPPPHRRVPLMVGSNGPRTLAIALPHADAWNTWWDAYGNDPERFAELNDFVSGAARDAGRQDVEIARSACVLVGFPGTGERPHHGVEPVAPARLAGHLRELAGAGADEAILVLDPITESSIRQAAAFMV